MMWSHGSDVWSGRTITFDPSSVLRGKKIMGSSMYQPRLLPLMMETLVKKQNEFPYDRIVSHRYPLESVNEAFAEAEWNDRQTEVMRGMLVP